MKSDKLANVYLNKTEKKKGKDLGEIPKEEHAQI